jgi:hypothetical protein
MPTVGSRSLSCSLPDREAPCHRETRAQWRPAAWETRQSLLAAAQAPLEQHEQLDIEAAAKAIRSGAPAPVATTGITPRRGEGEKNSVARLRRAVCTLA